jgi:hypothetical protein
MQSEKEGWRLDRVAEDPAASEGSVIPSRARIPGPGIANADARRLFNDRHIRVAGPQRRPRRDGDTPTASVRLHVRLLAPLVVEDSRGLPSRREGLRDWRTLVC